LVALMWLGLLCFTPDDADEEDGAMVRLFAWDAGRPRPLTFVAPAGAVAQTVRLLREAGAAVSIGKPHCDACGAPFDLPPLD